MTSLHKAAWNSRIAVAKLLIRSGADVNAADKVKFTLCHRIDITLCSYLTITLCHVSEADV